jgi:hypothetical protein
MNDPEVDSEKGRTSSPITGSEGKIIYLVSEGRALVGSLWHSQLRQLWGWDLQISKGYSCLCWAVEVKVPP